MSIFDFLSLGQESGFQSCTSLVSLGAIQHNQNHPNREYQNREYQNQIQPLLSHATAAAQPLVLPQQAKHSLFRGSPLALPKFQYAESSLSGSMASLASGVIVPSLVNGHISGSGLVNGMMRHSLNGGHAGQGHQRPESRLSVQHRRSARGQLTRQDQQRLQEQQRLPEPLIDPSEHFSPGKL